MTDSVSNQSSISLDDSVSLTDTVSKAANIQISDTISFTDTATGIEDAKEQTIPTETLALTANKKKHDSFAKQTYV